MFESESELDDLIQLLKYCLDFAKDMLTRYGEFHPFGAQIKKDGEFTCVGVDLGPENGSSRHDYLAMADVFRENFVLGEIRSAAMAADVLLPEYLRGIYKEGIRIHVDFGDFAKFYYIPYSLKRPLFWRILARKKYKVKLGKYTDLEVKPLVESGTENWDDKTEW